MADSTQINPLNASALKSILLETEAKLERQTAALLTVAESITLAAAKYHGENLTPVLARQMTLEIFNAFLKP